MKRAINVSIIYYIRTLLTVVARYQPGLYIHVSRSLWTVPYSIYLYSSLCLVACQSLLNPQPLPSLNRHTYSLALLSSSNIQGFDSIARDKQGLVSVSNVTTNT